MNKFINQPCPHLEYYRACHQLAQSLWRSGSPAQAILQLDKSFMAQTADNIPPTYQAILWIIQHTPDDQFLGNPVRHFQHLATRMNMSQPNAEHRIWRAWACLHLTEKFSSTPHPRDQDQIKKENLTIPSIKTTLENISTLTNTEEFYYLKKQFK